MHLLIYSDFIQYSIVAAILIQYCMLSNHTVPNMSNIPFTAIKSRPPINHLGGFKFVMKVLEKTSSGVKSPPLGMSFCREHMGFGAIVTEICFFLHSGSFL